MFEDLGCDVRGQTREQTASNLDRLWKLGVELGVFTSLERPQLHPIQLDIESKILYAVFSRHDDRKFLQGTGKSTVINHLQRRPHVLRGRLSVFIDSVTQDKDTTVVAGVARPDVDDGDAVVAARGGT